MSQYGYIPVTKSHLLKQDYTIATPATWQFEKETMIYGGVEDHVFSEEQKSELTTLGGDWFDNAEAFHEWYSQQSA